MSTWEERIRDVEICHLISHLLALAMMMMVCRWGWCKPLTVSVLGSSDAGSRWWKLSHCDSWAVGNQHKWKIITVVTWIHTVASSEYSLLTRCRNELNNLKAGVLVQRSAESPHSQKGHGCARLGAFSIAIASSWDRLQPSGPSTNLKISHANVWLI